MPLKLKKSSKMSLLLIPRYKNTSKLLKIALVPLRLKKKKFKRSYHISHSINVCRLLV